MLAKYFLSFFGSRSTFLFLPYRQSILTKLIQKHLLFYTPNSPYPGIVIPRGPSSVVAFLLDNVIKNKLSLNFPYIPRYVPDLDINATWVFTLSSSSLYDYLDKYGGLGVQVSFSRPNYIYNVEYFNDIGAYSQPEHSDTGRLITRYWFPDDGDLELNFSTGEIDDAFTFWIIYISPISSNIGGRYIIKNTGSTCGIIQFSAV